MAPGRKRGANRNKAKNQLSLGDLVLTKVKGFPAWPAKVDNKNMDKDTVVLLAARASRLENQDAIDTAIINMLADPKEARANITPVHFLPFNPVEKRTSITYIDSEGNWHRASKGAPEQQTGARDKGGNPLIKDYYSISLTARSTYVE